jgi:ATP-dependent DNA ligase
MKSGLRYTVAIQTELSDFPRLDPIGESKRLPADLTGAPRSPMPRNVEPMLCTLVPRPFDRPNWIFEIKWDDYRAIAGTEKSSVRLYSRKLKSLEGYFPQLIETLAKLNVEAVLDGEVVVLERAFNNGSPTKISAAGVARGLPPALKDSCGKWRSFELSPFRRSRLDRSSLTP